jgi:hypothetical protein
MISILRSTCLSGVIALAMASLALAEETNKHSMPIHNPFLAESAYPVAHGYSDFTTLPGPAGPSRQLRANEIVWKGVGPVNGFAPTYSGLYPNGKRVMWLGGYDRITKLDADSMAILSTYAIGGNTYFGAEEIERHVSTMDHMNDAEVAAYEQKLWRVPFRSVQASYRMVSNENELYIPLRLPSGTISLQVFGDAIANDPASDIVLKREWKIPPEISKANIMSVNMTYDGWVVMATQDGVLIALSRDFTTSHIVKLPRTGEEPADENFFNAFVRNGLTVDCHGGVYVVTRDNMHRVQWTGSKLSLDETDGAWSAPYPNEIGVGSGTTPTPMGWGLNEDHLIIIADGTRGNNAVAFWRDAIPADWKGLPGHNRRIAGITPVRFNVSPDEVIQVENAALVYGYGAFFNNFDNSFVAQHLPKKSGAITQKQEASGFVHMPGHNAAGGSRIDWDPKSRTLKTVWKTQVNFVNTVCTISGGSDMVYCWGLRNKQWTLEGTDWKTGASAFHYTLGKSKRYDALGGPIVVGPNGVVNCGCSGGLGIVQVRAYEK